MWAEMLRPPIRRGKGLCRAVSSPRSVTHTAVCRLGARRRRQARRRQAGVPRLCPETRHAARAEMAPGVSLLYRVSVWGGDLGFVSQNPEPSMLLWVQKDDESREKRER